MKNTISIFNIIVISLLSALTYSCVDKKSEKTVMKEKYNPVVYFEIPVTDIERAQRFYSSVFGFTFEKEIIDKNEMALFPFIEDISGISGALAKGEIYKPTKDGVVIYFYTDDIEKSLKLATENGGLILYPKTSNGELGFVAEIQDSEGNRVALHQKLLK
jgi:uncharacterized protein